MAAHNESPARARFLIPELDGGARGRQGRGVRADGGCTGELALARLNGRLSVPSAA
jgi:hypothetical protein